MAFDGITVSNIVKELSDRLTGARLSKIAQPESDELILTLKGSTGNYRLLMSANATLPLIYLTEKNKQSPMTAPGFCMLLRKHIANGMIVSITQPGLERIVVFDIEHLDEMGDLRHKKLIIELMGKHSNIIFCKEDDTIIDSIKHISGLVSSVREVLPGKPYFIPKTLEKSEIFDATADSFKEAIRQKPMPLYKALYGTYTGLSPIISQELCFMAGLDGEAPTAAFGDSDLDKLFEKLCVIRDRISKGDFAPGIVFQGDVPVEYAAFTLSIYNDTSHTTKNFETMSELLEEYYAKKELVSRMRQRSADLRKIVQTAYERNVKKYDLQIRQMKDTEKRDKYRVYGELLNAYGYEAKPGDKSLTAVNFYDGKEVTIPLDDTISATANAKKYFDKYQKMKRTFEALSELTVEVEGEIKHLESIMTSLDLATDESDLTGIRQELVDSGYIKKRGKDAPKAKKNLPLHYRDSEGNDYYVGKNNFQNDELTFKFAKGGDWWFHAKGMPGSHVILRTPENVKEPSDKAFERAAALAGAYSKGRELDKIDIDYVQKKEVKKPNGAKPGFVVYYTNFSMTITPGTKELTLVE